jgi:geranylgeranyl diphosphate synthase, type II
MTSAALDDVSFGADRRAVQSALVAVCASYLDDIPPIAAEAIRYGLLGEGKRIRAILLLSAYRAAGGRGDVAALAASVEVVHAYSPVHDDLPCMDDDDLRRGRPTAHRVFGVAAATAAGLAMVPLAARCAAEASIRLELPDTVCGTILRELMRAAGGGGMIGGQLLDLEGETKALSLGELERIHRAKTGALVTASVRIGGIAALGSPRVVDALDRYGSAVGLAFQIADDVLGVTATTDQLGKTAGRDVELQKSTYPALLGVEGAVARATALVDEACAVLDRERLLTPELAALAHFAVSRPS